MKLTWFFLSVLALAATSCGAKTSDGNGTDSNTHWLARCSADNDCGDGLSCVCGACTRQCSSSGSCESLDEGALCLDLLCDGEPLAVCSLGCNEPADCGSGTSCEGGACVPRLAEAPTTERPDAGRSDAGRSDAGRSDPQQPDAGPSPTQPPNYEPCAEKSCGDSCQLCGPDETDCAESAEPKYCTADGDCIDTEPECPVSSQCQAQDANSSGDDCLSVTGYAFDGTECTLINCGCVGSDCDEIYPSLGACQQGFRACLEPFPACTDDVFPLVDQEPALAPTYPEFTFDVVGTPELVDEETGEVAILSEWTPAEWLGATELLSGPPECPGTGEQASCPYPRQLSLSVDGEVVNLIVVVPWERFSLPAENQEVEVRIQRHPQGTLSFRVRDPITADALLMIVQRGDAFELEAAWEFATFTFRPGDTVCQGRTTDCNWVFLAQSLRVELSGLLHSELAPQRVGLIPVETSEGTVTYQISHSAFYVQTFDGEACGAVFAPQQSFALSPAAEQ